MMNNRKIFPVLAILAACTIWWLNGVFVKSLDLPHAQQTFFRLLVPFVITGLILVSRGWEKIHRRFTKFEFFTISGANALRMYLLNIGFILTTVWNAVIAQRSNVFLILILSYFILGEKLTWQKIASVFVGFMGLTFIAIEKGIHLGNENFLGICAIVGSATISSYLNIQYKQKIHSLGSTNTIFLQSCLWVLIFGIISFTNYGLPENHKIMLAVIHSFFIGVVGFYLFFWWLKHMEVSKATILTYFEVLSWIFFWYLILGQIPSFYTYSWVICIIASGIILAQKSKTRIL